MRLGGHRGRYGRFEEEKNPSLLPGKEPCLLGRPALSLVTVPNMLSLLPKQVSGNTTVYPLTSTNQTTKVETAYGLLFEKLDESKLLPVYLAMKAQGVALQLHAFLIVTLRFGVLSFTPQPIYQQRKS